MSAKPRLLRAFGSPPVATAADVVVDGVRSACVLVCFFAAAVLAVLRFFFAAVLDFEVLVAPDVLAPVRSGVVRPPPVSAIAATAPATSSSAARAATAGQRRGPRGSGRAGRRVWAPGRSGGGVLGGRRAAARGSRAGRASRGAGAGAGVRSN